MSGRLQSAIYRIYDLTTGLSYVGSTVDVKVRWKGHRVDLRRGVHHAARLQQAWMQYGEPNFVFGVLEWCPVEALHGREQFWMDFYQTADPARGYNSAPIAGSSRGRQASEALRKRFSEISKERWKNQPHPMLGKPRSEETKAKIRAAKAEYYLTHESPRKGAKLSSATKAKISESKLKWHQENDHPMLGKTHTPEARKKLSEAGKGRVPWNKGLPQTKEVKAKLSEALKGRAPSEATRAKLRKATRGEKNPSAKLNEAQVLQILETYATTKVSQAKLAVQFGVTQALVNLIVNGKSWTHVYTQFHRETNYG